MATQQELDELQDKLDLLIISYLDLFDKYQASRAETSRFLSDGFFNLAQANFNAPNRVRYGQDMYDNRMQALRGVHITVNENDVTAYKFKDLTALETTSSEGVDQEVPSNTKGSDIAADKERKPEVPAPGDSGAPTAVLDDTEVILTLANPKGDPLRWFGILRPKILGTAQKNFTQSLPPIMNLVSTLSDIEYHEKRIRAIRQEVREMRKELGINVGEGPPEETIAIPELDTLSISDDKSSGKGLSDGGSKAKGHHEEQSEDEKGSGEIDNTVKSTE